MVNFDKLKKGDQAEAERLIEEFMPQVTVLAYKLSRGGAACREDLIQIGLLALIDAARRYDGAKGASFSTFALTCAKRRMIDELRKEQRRPPLSDLSGAEGVCTETDLAGDTAKRDILKSLPEILSATELRVFFLKMRGASYAEIARGLAIGEKAVDNALARARKKIYELYNAI